MSGPPMTPEKRIIVTPTENDISPNKSKYHNEFPIKVEFFNI